MKKILFIFLVLFTSEAYAQKSNSLKPSFNGSYVGIDVGKAKARDYGYEPSILGEVINDNKLNGNIYGFHLGYNFSLTQDFYFSPVLEYKKGQDLRSDWNAQLVNGAPLGDCNFCMKTTFNHSTSLLGKVGYLLDEKNSINIAGGWTDVNLTRGEKNGGDNNFIFNVIDKLHSVPTYGAGYERIYDDKFSFVVDYRYLKSPTRKSSTDYFGFQEFYSYRQETITAGINYRF
jgi:opacity protein-like surface antigen